MGKLVLNKSLNDFSRKYLVKGNEPSINDAMMLPSEFERVINEVAEQLLYHDGISFKVYGENIPLTILINTFGTKGVEELLEQKAIEFVLWTPAVTYIVDDIPGLLPLQSGTLNSKAHCDPEESATLGLNWMQYPLPRKTRRYLVRKITKAYKLPDPGIPKYAVEFGYQGYKDNIFAQFGLPNGKSLEELDKAERAKLCSFSDECLELAILSSFKYDSIESKRLTELNRTEFQRLHHAKVIEDVADYIFKIENVPNFKELIVQGFIDIKQIPKIRSNNSSVKFRSWISKYDSNTSSEDIVKEYLNSIVNSKGIFDTPKGKFLKTLGVTAFSGAVGCLIGGEIGLLVGATASKIAESFIDLGLNLLDAYVFEGLTKGWSPRHYIDKEIRGLVEKKK
jgi:hypothetical protein